MILRSNIANIISIIIKFSYSASFTNLFHMHWKFFMRISLLILSFKRIIGSCSIKFSTVLIQIFKLVKKIIIKKTKKIGLCYPTEKLGFKLKTSLSRLKRLADIFKRKIKSVISATILHNYNNHNHTSPIKT